MNVVWDERESNYLCSGHGFEFRAELSGKTDRIVEASIYDTAGTGEFLDVLEMDAPGNTIPDASKVAAAFAPGLKAFRERLRREKADCTVTMPIAFTATDCYMLEPENEREEEYWTACVKAVRPGLFAKEFHNVLFVERPGKLVYLAGIGSEDGIDRHIFPELAAEQSAFIRFLRDENQRDHRAIGPSSSMLEGSEYSTVAKATVAYMAALGLTHPFGVGYTDVEGHYQRIALTCSEEFVGSVVCPFHEFKIEGD